MTLNLSRKKLHEIVWCIDAAISYHNYYQEGKWKGKARLERIRQELLDYLKMTKEEGEMDE